jgi:hypothetical protein
MYFAKQLSNHSFQGTAGKLRLPVRSGLRPPPAPELKLQGLPHRVQVF